MYHFEQGCPKVSNSSNLDLRHGIRMFAAIFRDELQACNYIKQMKETVQIIEASWTKRRIRSKSQNYT